MIQIWSPKPPPGPLSKTAERVLLVLGIVMTVPILVFIVLGGIWIGSRIVEWFTAR
jgi:hypothetical protein